MSNFYVILFGYVHMYFFENIIFFFSFLIWKY